MQKPTLATFINFTDCPSSATSRRPLLRLDA